MKYERVDNYIDKYQSTKARRKVKGKEYGYLYRVRIPPLKKYKNIEFYKGDLSTLKQAREERDAFIYEVTHGLYREQCKLTLNQVYQEWYELEKTTNTLRPQTFRSYTTRVKKILVPLGDETFIDITYKEIQQEFNKLDVTHTNTIIKACLSKVYDYAIKQGYTSTNIANLIEIKTPPKKTKSANDEYLSYNDFKALYDSLMRSNKFSVKGYAIAIAIGYYTGLRIGEIRALEKSDVDLLNNTITINKQAYSCEAKGNVKPMPPKTKKSNAIIPLQHELKSILIEWFKVNPYDVIVCDELGNYIIYASINTTAKNHANKLGLENFHFHMLRTTFITNVYKNTGDLKTVQELARHESVNTSLNIYTVLPFEALRSAIDNAFSDDSYKIDAKNENQGGLN